MRGAKRQANMVSLVGAGTYEILPTSLGRRGKAKEAKNKNDKNWQK